MKIGKKIISWPQTDSKLQRTWNDNWQNGSRRHFNTPSAPLYEKVKKLTKESQQQEVRQIDWIHQKWFGLMLFFLDKAKPGIDMNLLCSV